MASSPSVCSHSGLWDSHIHVGEFRESSFSPSYIASVVNRLCLEGVVAMSTTSVTGNYERARAELEELEQRSRAQVVKLLWITDALFRSPRQLRRLLNQGYSGIKLEI